TFEEGALAEGLPTFVIDAAKLAAGIPIANLAQLAGLTSSTSEARRFIQQNGLSVNGTPVSDVKAMVSSADLQDGVIKLSLRPQKAHARETELDDSLTLRVMAGLVRATQVNVGQRAWIGTWVLFPRTPTPRLRCARRE